MASPVPDSAPAARVAASPLLTAGRIVTAAVLALVFCLVGLTAIPAAKGFFDRGLQGELSREFHLMRLELTVTALLVACLVMLYVWLRSAHPRWLRIVFAAVFLLLALLAVYAWLTADPYHIRYRFDSEQVVKDIAIVVGLFLAVPFLTIVGYRVMDGWRRVLIGWAMVGCVVCYLVDDDPSPVESPTLARLSPEFDGARASYDVLMRYAKNRPLATEFKNPMGFWAKGAPPFATPDDPAKWAGWLAGSRPAITTEWEELKPLRDWFDDLNRFERIGDLTPARIDAELPAFQPLRTYTQHACARAGLLALDGKGDEALTCLLPLLEVSRKLEPSSRTLVRAMIAKVMQRQAIGAARFIVARTPVSPALQARLAHALALGIGGAEGARRVETIEETFQCEVIATRGFTYLFNLSGDPSTKVFGIASFLLYNQNRTLNTTIGYGSALAAAAAQRDLPEIDRLGAALVHAAAAPHVKNFMGWRLLVLYGPAYSKVIENYWKTEDLRTALLAQLAARGPAEAVRP